MEYEHEYETLEGTLRLKTYRNDRNAYIRWSLGDRSGEFGGLTRDGSLVLDVEEYVRSNGDSETVGLPEDAAEALRDELDEIRDEIAEEMTADEREAFEDDKRVILRAREILQEEGFPEPDDTETYAYDRVDGRGETEVITLTAEPRDGVAEVYVEAGNVEGYAPKFDLGDGVLSLPANDWGISREIEVPDDVSGKLLDDLKEVQETLNDRREAYSDAVERARDEILD